MKSFIRGFNFLYRLGIHDWTTWTKPAKTFKMISVILGFVGQTRTCIRCKIHQVREI